jgi:hypothetical protein
VARALNSPFPMVPLRDLPGYVKEGRTPPARLGATCRGAVRAKVRRVRRLPLDRTYAANQRSLPHRMRKAWSISIAWLAAQVSAAATLKLRLGDRRG